MKATTARTAGQWRVRAEGPDRDARDAAAIYDLLEKDIVPLFYDVDEDGVSHGWAAVMKEAIKMTGPQLLRSQDGQGVHREVL